MHRAIVVSISLLLYIHTTEIQAIQQVDQFGNLNCFVFHGAKTFHPEQLRNALSWSSDFQRAATPSAPLEGLLLSTEQILKTGYLHAGFPKAKVTAHKSSVRNEVIIEVEEGPRVMAGEVEIRGASKIDTARLSRRITMPYTRKALLGQAPGKSSSEPDPPSWDLGKPAPLDTTTTAKLNRQLQQACRDQGFFFTQLESTVVSDVQTRTARLVVTITAEGPPGTIQEIQVEGLKKNSRQNLLEFLDLRVGNPVNQQSLVQMRRQLWKSARFTKFSVEPQVPETGQARICLKLTVIEYEDAPPLGTPLSAEVLAMFRVQQWLSRFAASKHDLVFTYQPTSSTVNSNIPIKKAQLIFSPKQGFVIDVTGKADSVYSGHHSLVLRNEQLGIYSWKSKRYFLTRGWKIQPEFTLAMVPSYDEMSRETSSDLRIGLAFTSVTDDKKPLNMKTHFQFSPTVFLRETLKPSNQVTVTDNEVLLKNDSLIFRANARTGEIKQLQFIKLPGTRIEFQTTAWQQAVDKLTEAAAGFENCCQPSQPVESLVQFVLNETLTQMGAADHPMAVADQQQAIQQLTTATLKSADAWLQRFTNNHRNNFVIPRSLPASQEKLLTAILVAVPVVTDPWFPRGSWPWTLSRQTALTMAGKARYTGSELQRLLETEPMGPVGYWAIAAFLKKFGAPNYRPVANHALGLINHSAFLHDAQLLVNQDAGTGQLISTIGKNLRNMKTQTVTALIQPLPDNLQNFIKDWSLRLHRHPDRPTTELFLETVEKTWHEELSRHVRGQLQGLIDPSIRTAQQPKASTPKDPR